MESEDEDDKKEEIKPKKSEKKKKKKKESDDEEDKKEEIKPKKEEIKPKKSEKKSVKKTESDNDSDSDSKPKKGEKKPEKKPKMKDDMDISDSDSDSELKQNPKKEEKPKKETKQEESEEESKEEKGAKETAKKEESSENNQEEDENKKDDKEEELPENAYEELFVRNIGFNTTQEELADFFAKYGDVEESKIVTDKNTGKSRGFGFLKFYEKKAAVAAMKDADNIVVGGRNLQIRYSNDKGSQMQGSGNSAKKGPVTEFGVFVGNISYKCTENDLKKFFKDCGKVADVRIAKKPDGKLKGFAHVDFETKEGMEKAVEKNGKELQGRALRIDKSTSGNGRGGNSANKGRGKGRDNVDPMAKAKRTGGIIAPTENKVTTYDDSDDE